MKGNDRAWLLVVFAAFGVAAVPAARFGGSAPGAPPANGAAKGRGKASGGHRQEALPAASKLRELLQGYLPAEMPTLEAAAAQYRAESGAIDVLIATAPDPDQTSSDSYFDQELDSFRTAAQDAGFVPDRFYLPWGAASDALDLDLDITSDGEGEGALPPMRLKNHREDQARETPAMLVFRQPHIRGERLRVDLLVVLVVGETVARGVHRAAFDAALKLGDLLQPYLGRHSLLGPFFTGSVTSVRLALTEHRRTHDDHPGCGATTVAISGSANGASLSPGILGPETTFSTTNLPAADLHRLILETLPTERVAELVEVGSTWGRDLAQSPDLPPHLKVRSFGFPLHIAQLRSERERLRPASTERTANLRSTLELRLDHDRGAVDDVPIRSALSAYDIELMLQQQLAIIARKQYRYLGILATDPADIIFLAQEVRKRCPGIQLFTLESNLLFQHPDLIRDLNGTLVASSYPLVGNGKHAFASQAAEGAYNAALALLADILPPRSVPALHDYYRHPNGDASPAAWITMINNGAIWPLKVIHDPPPAILYRPPLNKVDATVDAAVHIPRPGGVIMGAYWALLLFTLFQVAVFASRQGDRGGPRPSRSDPLAKERARYLLATWFPPAFLCAYPLVLLCHAFHRFGWLPCATVVMGLAMTAATTAVAAIALVRLVPRSLRPSSRRGLFHLALAVTPIALVGYWAIAFVWPLLRASRGAPEIALEVFRTLQPMGGVSPLLPVVFMMAGLSLWGAFGLQRIREQQRFPRETPFPPVEGLSSAGLGVLAEEVRADRTRRFFMSEQVTALGAYTIFGVYLWFQMLPTLERPTFDSFFLALLLVVAALVTSTAARMVGTWRRLRRLLRRLAGHPMADAYDRIGSGNSRALDLEIDARVPGRDEQEVAIRMAEQLAQRQPPFTDATLTEVYHERLRREADAAKEIYTVEIRVGGVDGRAETQTALFRLAGTVFELLEQLWSGAAKAETAASLQHVMEQVAPADAREDGPYRNVPTLALYRRSVAPEAQLWQRLAEDFVASQVVALFKLALGRLRAMQTFGICGALAMVAAGGSYPFQPGRLLTVFVWTVALAVISAILWTVVGLERDEVLSRIAQTRPGRISFNAAFFGKLALYGGVPLAALVVGHFPEAGAVVLSWIEPLVRAMP